MAVTVSNNDLALLKYILKVIGVGKITTKKIYKDTHNSSYTYSVYSRQALDLLSQIDSYLRTYKLKRARLALKEYLLVTPRNGKYDEFLLKKKQKFVDKFFLITP